jgi:hypothetical protein
VNRLKHCHQEGIRLAHAAKRHVIAKDRLTLPAFIDAEKTSLVANASRVWKLTARLNVHYGAREVRYGGRSGTIHHEDSFRDGNAFVINSGLGP